MRVMRRFFGSLVIGVALVSIIFASSDFLFGGAATPAAGIWLDRVKRVAFEVILVVGITMLLFRWSVVGPLRRMEAWLKARRLGAGPTSHVPPAQESVFSPLVHEVSQLVTSLD